MKELNFRTLTPDEIDVRVDQTFFTPKFIGCRVLLYKDARVDMNLLDEVVKPLNWKREHRRENANCVVSIWDEEKKEWISKEDTGSESNQDKEKGLASDSFKRACVNWGIGRELYSAPKAMLVNLTDADFYENSGKKCLNKNIKFSVKEIEYDEKRNIKRLIIVNQDGDVAYEFPSKPKKSSQNATPQQKQEKHVEQPKKEQEKPAAPAPQPKQPAQPLQLTEEEENNYTELCADLDNADCVNTVLAIALMAEGQKYELSIRKAAAKKGIQLAANTDEIKKAYALIQGREGWQELNALATTTAKAKGFVKP